MAGFIDDNAELMKNTLAATQAFKDFTGTTNDNAAKNRIHFIDLPDPSGDNHTREELEALRPLAIIGLLEQGGFTAGRIAAVDQFGASGVFEISFEKNADNAGEGTVYRNFLKEVDKIIRSGDSSNPGLAELSGISPNLSMQQFELEGPYRSDPDKIATQGDFMLAFVRVFWGLNEVGGF